MTSCQRRLLGFLILAGVFFASACARVRPLSGGPADEEAPTLVAVEPADSSTALPLQPKLHLKFSEDVSASSVRRALRFYPSVRREDIRVKGSRVEVTFADSIPADTTLIVVVGEALEDRPPRSNNLEKEVWILYSSGDTLRSAAVFGRVSVKGKPEPKGAVQFEPVPRDSARAGPPPRYPLAATDTLGLFRMLGLPPGRSFVLRAFLDRNDNLQLDDNELAAAYPETLLLSDAEMRRGIEWNLIDPNEPARIEGVAINRSSLEGPIAVALRLLPAAEDTISGSAGPSAAAVVEASAAAIADSASVDARADTLRPLPLPVAERGASGWDAAYARLEPVGFVKTLWLVVYASPRGDYSVRVPAGRHEILAFVDVSRDSVPGLYVGADSTRLEWEPLWVGGVVHVGPGEDLRPRAIEIEPSALPGP